MLRTKCAGLLRAIRQGGGLGSAAAELGSSKVWLPCMLHCLRDVG